MKNKSIDTVMKLVLKRTEAFWFCAGIPYSETKDRKTLKMFKELLKKFDNLYRHMERITAS